MSHESVIIFQYKPIYVGKIDKTRKGYFVDWIELSEGGRLCCFERLFTSLDRANEHRQQLINDGAKV